MHDSVGDIAVEIILGVIGVTKHLSRVVVAVGGNQPTVKGLPLILQFQLIFQFFGASLNGYVIGHGHRPGDILNDQSALGQADELRKKLAELA